MFHAGEAEGDTILDFSGNGTLAGDSLRLVGFGAGAVLAKAGVGDFWSITYNGGMAIETIELVGVTSLSSNDVIFV